MLLNDGDALYVLKRMDARFEEIVYEDVSIWHRSTTLLDLTWVVERTLGAIIGLSDSMEIRGMIDYCNRVVYACSDNDVRCGV